MEETHTPPPPESRYSLDDHDGRHADRLVSAKGVPELDDNDHGDRARADARARPLLWRDGGVEHVPRPGILAGRRRHLERGLVIVMSAWTLSASTVMALILCSETAWTSLTGTGVSCAFQMPVATLSCRPWLVAAAILRSSDTDSAAPRRSRDRRHTCAGTPRRRRWGVSASSREG
jgi:hypothetical protein